MFIVLQTHHSLDMPRIGLLFLACLLLCSNLSRVQASLTPAEAADDQDCLMLVKSAVSDAQAGSAPALEPENLTLALQRGWWSCAEELIKVLAAESQHSKAVDHVFQTEQSGITRKLSALRYTLEASKPVQQVRVYQSVHKRHRSCRTRTWPAVSALAADAA
jgi:hypothetical protein